MCVVLRRLGSVCAYRVMLRLVSIIVRVLLHRLNLGRFARTQSPFGRGWPIFELFM